PFSGIEFGSQPITMKKQHVEHHRIHRSGWLRAAVLGANDGIVSTASLIVGWRQPMRPVAAHPSRSDREHGRTADGQLAKRVIHDRPRDHSRGWLCKGMSSSKAGTPF